MSEGIICALITGGISLVGIIVTNISSNKKIENQLDKQQAIMNTKLEGLTTEVREHNNFARRVPILEAKMEQLEKIIEKKIDL